MKRKRGWSANEALERSRAKRGYRSRTKDMHIEWGGGGGRSRRGWKRVVEGRPAQDRWKWKKPRGRRWRVPPRRLSNATWRDTGAARSRASARGLKKTGRWFLDTFQRSLRSPNFSLNILEDRRFCYLKRVPGIIFIY